MRPTDVPQQSQELHATPSNGVGRQPALYTHFVKAKPLEGTIPPPPIKSGPISANISRVKSEDATAEEITNGSVNGKSTAHVEKKSKKRKHGDDGRADHRKSKKSKRGKHSNGTTDIEPMPSQLEKVKTKNSKKLKKGDNERERNSGHGDNVVKIEKVKMREAEDSTGDEGKEDVFADVNGSQNGVVDDTFKMNLARQQFLSGASTVVAMTTPANLNGKDSTHTGATVGSEFVNGARRERSKKSKKKGKNPG